VITNSSSQHIAQLKRRLEQSERVVFFGGAGVSTESGIPDFRSTDGVYNQQYDFPPEQIISHSFWKANTAEFYRFYRNKMLFLDAQPNPAHKFLASLQIPVITQNIDGLHQNAGSKEVHELHGSVHNNYCTKCGAGQNLAQMVKLIDAANDHIPKCPEANCVGILKPAVVLYEEALDDAVWNQARTKVQRADTLIVGGTSLVVYPAASMVSYFSGRNLIVINKDKLHLNMPGNFDILQINRPIGEVFQSML
jgi:NAD-dependent deacetylase